MTVALTMLVSLMAVKNRATSTASDTPPQNEWRSTRMVNRFRRPPSTAIMIRA